MFSLHIEPPSYVADPIVHWFYCFDHHVSLVYVQVCLSLHGGRGRWLLYFNCIILLLCACICSVSMRGSRTFCQRGSTLFCFFVCVCLVDEDPNTTKSWSSSARQRNAIEIAFCCWADDGPTLNACLVALWFIWGSGQVLQMKPLVKQPLKIDKTRILMKNGSLMKVESIAECSPQSILQYVGPA